VSAETPTHKVLRFQADQMTDALEYFRRYGYVVFRDAFPAEVGELFWAEVERAMTNAPVTFSVYGKLHVAPDIPFEGRRLPRIVDIETHVPVAKELMLASVVRQFLGAYYSAPPTCIQTLTYKFSSEQGAHSDLTLVSPPTAGAYNRGSLAAAWFGIEHSNAANGALIIYPGSHLFEKRGITDFAEYHEYIHYCDEVCRERGIQPVAFEAMPSDVLFWHGDFVHAGGPILDQATMPTRRSLVCHYACIPQELDCPDPNFKRIHWSGASFYQRA